MRLTKEQKMSLRLRIDQYDYFEGLSLEDRVTYVLSEWLNDSAPLGQERYREPAKAVIEIVKDFMARKEPLK
jgi:hypothetical protein